MSAVNIALRSQIREMIIGFGPITPDQPMTWDSADRLAGMVELGIRHRKRLAREAAEKAAQKV